MPFKLRVVSILETLLKHMKTPQLLEVKWDTIALLEPPFLTVLSCSLEQSAWHLSISSL